MMNKIFTLFCLCYGCMSYGNELQEGNMPIQSFIIPEAINSSNYSKEMKIGLEAAFRAGKEILRIRETNQLQVEVKEDASLVTLADKTSNELLCQILMENFPTYGLLTEEKIEGPVSFQKAIDEWSSFEKTWMVDPLDGTENFSRNGNDFGIHIGLTENGIPVLGINYYPVLNTVYFAVKGLGAYKKTGSDDIERLFLKNHAGEIRPIYSRSEGRLATIYEQLLDNVDNEKVFLGSCGLRLCTIAEGINNLYIYEGGRAGLWDFCSGHVIVNEAGGYLTDWRGYPIDYQHKNAKLQNGVIVSGHQDIHEQAIQVLTTKNL